MLHVVLCDEGRRFWFRWSSSGVRQFLIVQVHVVIIPVVGDPTLYNNNVLSVW
jgi:hypothetical protein